MWILTPCVFIQESAKDLREVCRQMLDLSPLWFPPLQDFSPQGATPHLPAPVYITSLLISPARLQTFGVLGSAFYPIVPSQCLTYIQ